MGQYPLNECSWLKFRNKLFSQGSGNSAFFCQSLGESTLRFLHKLKWNLIIWGSVAEPQIIQVSFGFLTLLAFQVPGGFWVALLKQVFSSCAPCLGRGPRKITAPWKKIFRKIKRRTYKHYLISEGQYPLDDCSWMKFWTKLFSQGRGKWVFVARSSENLPYELCCIVCCTI